MSKISRNSRIKLASILLGLEAITVFGSGIYLLIKRFTAKNISDANALNGEIVFAMLGTAALIFLSISILRDKRFAYAPSILINLIFIGVSKYMFDENLRFPGIPLVFIGVITTISVVSLASK